MSGDHRMRTLLYDSKGSGLCSFNKLDDAGVRQKIMHLWSGTGIHQLRDATNYSWRRCMKRLISQRMPQKNQKVKPVVGELYAEAAGFASTDAKLHWLPSVAAHCLPFFHPAGFE